MQTRIVLADEQTIFRDAMRALIEKRDDFSVVGEAKDGTSTLEAVEELKPDVLLTDVALPRLSGIEVTKRMVSAGCGSRVLILSSHHGANLQQALEAGAAGFLCKTDPSEELLQAIDSVRSGRRYVSPSVAHQLVEIVATGDRDGEPGSGRLTGREREVLQLVAEGLSSKEIAANLGLSTRTVESHRANLMDKLGIHKVSGLVRYAIREGILSP